MRKFWISFIALLMGVVIGVGIWHGIAHEDNLKSIAKDAWAKIESVFVKNDGNDSQKPNEEKPDQPTPDKPSEEQINLDGLYYLDVDGDTTFVQIKDSKYGTINGYIQDSKIYLASDWESEVELEPLHTTEDDKYLHVFVTDQANGQEYKIAIYDKTTKKLYYDFSNGDQFPGETYEEQLLFEMVPFTEFVEIECQHKTIMDMTKTQPTCTEPGLKENWCYDCNKFLGTETLPALGHDWVDGVCSRCGTQCQHVHENGHICPICGCEVEKKLTWRVGKPATCTENGVEYGDCICGYNSEMREIPATGHTFDAGICTSCNALDEEFYNNFVGYWFTETTGFKKESFGKYYIQVYKDGDNYIFTRSGYKVENGEIVLYQNSTDYSDPETWTFTSTNRINEFTLTRQDITFNGTYDGQTLVVGDMTFTKTDKPIRYDGSTSYVTPL